MLHRPGCPPRGWRPAGPFTFQADAIMGRGLCWKAMASLGSAGPSKKPPLHLHRGGHLAAVGVSGPDQSVGARGGGGATDSSPGSSLRSLPSCTDSDRVPACRCASGGWLKRPITRSLQRTTTPRRARRARCRTPADAFAGGLVARLDPRACSPRDRLNSLPLSGRSFCAW